MFQDAGIQGVIFDLDDTLIPEFHGRFVDDVLIMLRDLSGAGIQLAIVTNNFRESYCREVSEQLEAEQFNIFILQNSYKPFQESFRHIQRLFGLPAHQIAVVGDGILTDRLGARLAGFRYFKPLWFRRPFYKRGPLLALREFIVLLSDLFRYLLLGHRSRLNVIYNGLTSPQRHYLFLLNPDSGQSDVEALDSLIRGTLEGTPYRYTIHVIRSFKKLKGRFGKALRLGDFTHVITAGGDGTVRAGIALVAESNRQIPIGILPTGTGNLLAKSIDIPMTLPEALQIACFGNPTPFSLTRVNRTYATLVAGMGADAEIMEMTSSPMKRAYGTIAYVFSAIKVALFKEKSLYWITLDGKRTVVRRAFGVLVIQRNHFKKAFLPLTPDHAENEYQLDICLIKTGNRLELLPLVQELLDAQYRTGDSMIEHFTARKVTVRSFPAEKIQVDGDVIADQTLNARILKDHIRLMS
ncbi:MAG: diacylglycerol kinase family protein [Candidatus Melainabacteria bacterium]